MGSSGGENPVCPQGNNGKGAPTAMAKPQCTKRKEPANHTNHSNPEAFDSCHSCDSLAPSLLHPESIEDSWRTDYRRVMGLAAKDDSHFGFRPADHIR